MGTQWLGAHFVYLENTDSTNSYLKKISTDDFIHGTVVLADNQSSGRGRYNKTWESEKGKNLTFTVGFKPANGERLTLLTLASALAVKVALQPLINTRSVIKWPNDILVNGKKIAGLLTECIFNGPAPEKVLIGIGINVNQTKFSRNLNHSAISVKTLNLKESLPSREELFANILKHIELIYTRWLKQDQHLHLEINRELYGYGKWVQIEVDGKIREEEYKFCGINEKGYLVVLNSDLDIKTFSYEQVRIHKILERV